MCLIKLSDVPTYSKLSVMTRQIIVIIIIILFNAKSVDFLKYSSLVLKQLSTTKTHM